MINAFIVLLVFRQKKLPFCHLWYKNFTAPIVSPARDFYDVDPNKGPKNYLQYPLILGCYPPDSVKHLVPMSVSLVETRCPKKTPSNNLRVFDDKHESGHKQGFAVCVKHLIQMADMSLRYIEWIELLRSFGVEKIIIKVLAVHPNVIKVISIYMNTTSLITNRSHGFSSLFCMKKRSTANFL